MTDSPEIVYTLFSSLFVANIILLIVGFIGARLWIKVTMVPKSLLYPMIFAFSIIGSYAVRSSLFDVGVCASFGVIGWLLSKFHYPSSPIVLGLVLGTLIEMNLQMTLLMDGPQMFFTRPLSAVLLALSALSLLAPIVRGLRAKHKTQ